MCSRGHRQLCTGGQVRQARWRATRSTSRLSWPPPRSWERSLLASTLLIRPAVEVGQPGRPSWHAPQCAPARWLGRRADMLYLETARARRCPRALLRPRSRRGQEYSRPLQSWSEYDSRRHRPRRFGRCTRWLNALPPDACVDPSLAVSELPARSHRARATAPHACSLVRVNPMLTRTRCTRFCLVPLPVSGAMSEAGGSATVAPGIDLWGVCALTGIHSGLGSCANHYPCKCPAPGAEHVRFHPLCTHCDPVKQRSDVWPALTGLVPHGNITLVEPDGQRAQEPTYGWFFGVPASLNVRGQRIHLHVRTRRSPRLAPPPPRLLPRTSHNPPTVPSLMPLREDRDRARLLRR